MAKMRTGIRRKVAVAAIALGAIGVVGAATPAYAFTGLSLPGSTTTQTTVSSGSGSGIHVSYTPQKADGTL